MSSEQAQVTKLQSFGLRLYLMCIFIAVPIVGAIANIVIGRETLKKISSAPTTVVSRVGIKSLLVLSYVQLGVFIIGLLASILIPWMAGLSKR